MSDATFTPAEAAEVAAEVLPAMARRRSSRRALLARSGVAAGLAAGAGLFARPNRAEAILAKQYGPKNRKFQINDVDILNFALNLEYLEAEFYQVAAFGKPLTAGDITGTGTQGVVIGGAQVPFGDPVIQQYAEEIAADELNHVRFLRAALGAKAVSRPTIDLSNSFTAAAQAAGFVDATTGTFSPFTTNTTTSGTASADYSFLLGAFIFEDVGVTAYQGAAPYIASPTHLGAAAGILAVEAQHASEIRTTLYINVAEGAGALATIADAIAATRNTLSKNADGVAVTDEGISAASGTSTTANIVPANANGMTYARSFAAVLNIVYLGGYNVLASAGVGGFFPNGLNGRIT
jgi:hypothetical protein